MEKRNLEIHEIIAKRIVEIIDDIDCIIKEQAKIQEEEKNLQKIAANPIPYVDTEYHRQNIKFLEEKRD